LFDLPKHERKTRRSLLLLFLRKKSKERRREGGQVKTRLLSFSNFYRILDEEVGGDVFGVVVEREWVDEWR